MYEFPRVRAASPCRPGPGNSGLGDFVAELLFFRVLAKLRPVERQHKASAPGESRTMMSSTFDRRSFLTHSAATIGGVALVGSVVDDLLAASAGAAAIGVNTGKPRRGGTLTVGTLSDVPNYHVFNGSQGKLDASGFCVANALYD